MHAKYGCVTRGSVKTVCLLILLLSSSMPLAAETVYLRPAEALRVIFRSSQEVILQKKSLTEEQKTALGKRLGRKITRTDWNFYVARSDGKVDGYALIDNEVGKMEPITFLTAITPQGEVKEVEILVFREPIGGEVHDKRFLKQYRGKKLEDPIRIGQDVANISGATMSARAVSLGVKRALAIWQVFYGK